MSLQLGNSRYKVTTYQNTSQLSCDLYKYIMYIMIMIMAYYVI